MEKLLNEFVVHRPIGETWEVLTDIERIAPCMPGAELHEIEGDMFRGAVKIKLGSISAAFKGQASFVERDDTNHRAVLKADGRDTAGKGNASANITAELGEVDGGSTKVVVATDLHITGKVAQFGRGIVADVSKKLINQFADNLNTMLEHGDQPAADGPPVQLAAADASTIAAADEAPPGGAVDAGTAEEPAPAKSTVRKIEGPAAEPIELSGVAGPAIVKRLLPLFAGLALLLLVLRRLRK
jgi:uncharacterized protein